MDMCVKEVTNNKEKNVFDTDVINGLSQAQKKLLPKYFYDESGCKIYKEITELEEYYLTRTKKFMNFLIHNLILQQNFQIGIDHLIQTELSLSAPPCGLAELLLFGQHCLR